jgi:predicted metal-dependent phosphoesterase TrpH
MTTLHLIPTDVAQNYEVHEWRNAAGVLSTAHPTEWQDVIDALRAFEFRRSEVLKGGGRKSVIANRIDSFLEERGWKEKKFATKIRVDEEEREITQAKYVEDAEPIVEQVTPDDEEDSE